MKKKLLLLPLVIILIVLVIWQGGFSETNQEKTDSIVAESLNQEFGDKWSLRSRNTAALTEEIASWANRHFGENSEIVGSASVEPQASVSQEDVFPVLPLSFENLVEFEVIPIPKERRVPGYEKLKLPSYHAVALLRDGKGDLFSATVMAFDRNAERFAVQSIGPALDVSSEAVNLSIEERRLQSWPKPSMSIQSFDGRSDGKPVLIPYPYAMDQIFYQYGDDPSTSVFVSIHTREVYHGLNEVLDEIDAAWASLR